MKGLFIIFDSGEVSGGEIKITVPGSGDGRSLGSNRADFLFGNSIESPC